MIKRVESLWADDLRQVQKSDEIARYKDMMTPAYLKGGDASAGRMVFEQTCAKCHSLFGEGGSTAERTGGVLRVRGQLVLPTHQHSSRGAGS